jgi:xanthine dehydrogenase accessory factor
MKLEIYKALQDARAEKRAAVLATDLENGAQALLLGEETLGNLKLDAEAKSAAAAAIRADRSQTLEGKLFLQVFNPPLRLVIVGAVHIAQALAPLAQLAGYEVTIVDPRKAWATPERFPGLEIIDLWPDEGLEGLALDHRTAVITLTHDPKLDDPALLVALKSPVFYVGSLGSTRTHAKRVERLREAGLSEAEIGRIHAPLGLAIGAKSPAEIALSALAQMTQVLRGAPALVRRENAA